VVAGIVIVALSPLGPVGLARKLEFDITVRFDWPVLAVTLLALLTLFALVALVTPVDSEETRPYPATVRTSRLDPTLRSLGPVALVGATVARGRSSRVAVAVTAVAIAACIAAGGLVASYDRLVGAPERYGASWDVAVGQYSQSDALAAGIAKLRAN